MDSTDLTPDMIRHIADLAMITLTDEEVAKYQRQLPSILEYVHKVNEIASEATTYQSHVDLQNVTRDDEVEPSLTQDAVIQNRQDTAQQGFFAVDSVISGGES